MFSSQKSEQELVTYDLIANINFAHSFQFAQDQADEYLE